MTTFADLRHRSLDSIAQDHLATLPKWQARADSLWGRLCVRWPLVFFTAKVLAYCVITIPILWAVIIMAGNYGPIQTALLMAAAFVVVILASAAFALYRFSPSGLAALPRIPYCALAQSEKIVIMQWLIYSMRYLDDPLLMQDYEKVLVKGCPGGWWLALIEHIQSFDGEFNAALAAHKDAQHLAKLRTL